MNGELNGIITAMVTPTTKDGRLSEDGLRKFVRYQLDGGVHGLFITGTTGEAYAFDFEERKKIIEITLEEVDGRIPVCVGTGAITTSESIKLSKMAEDCGADALSVLTPMFISVSQDELGEHFKRIAEQTKLPILLYNNLPKTGINITPALAKKMSEVDNIVGIKDSTGDMTTTIEYIRLTRDAKKEFKIFAGRDTLVYGALCHGASGAVTGVANVAPKLMVDIYEKYMSGDLKGSLEAQMAIAPLRLAFNIGSFPSVVKECLDMIGISAGPCVPPIMPISEEDRAKVRDILKSLDLI